MKEIAIRLALGARQMQVFFAVLGQFWLPVVIGLLAGLGFAAGTSKALRKMLFGVSNLDPASYAAAIAILIAVIVAATLLPARKAFRVDLATTLHHD
jgi:ABC-type antimicrobial peptide transport system permease subunit